MADQKIACITACRVCGVKFQNWQVDAPVVGKPRAKALEDFVTRLMRHIKSRHPDKWEAIQTGGGEFMAMLSLMLYETSDAHLVASVNEVRDGVERMLATEMRAAPLVISPNAKP